MSAGLVLTTGIAIAQSSDADSTLPNITVKAKAAEGIQKPHAGGQVARGGSVGLLGANDTMNVPFSTINYTAELLQDQQVRTLADVVINDASVRLTTGSGGFDDTFQIRGFAVSATDVGFNGLYGLISPNHVRAQLIERVEVLKGPGALVNGIAPSGSVGGSINIVSKQAGDVPLTRLTTTYQSSANLALHADIGRRFGEDNAWGVRFNGQVRSGEASVDDGKQKEALGALALDYRTSKLRWSLDTIVQRDDTTNFRPQISLDGNTQTIPAPPDARTNWYPGTKLVQKDSTLATRLDYQVNDALSAYAGIGYRYGSNDQVFPSSTTAVNAAGNFRVQNNYYDSYTKTTSGNAGLRWTFRTASVGHTLTAGVTRMAQESGNAYITGTQANSNIYNPVPLPSITSPRTSPKRSSESTLSSFAIADTLSFINDRLLVTLGARDQTVQQDTINQTSGIRTARYKAGTIAPLAGVVFKPIENVAVYANRTSGLTRGTTVAQQYDNRGTILAPYKSTQYEAGVKVDWGNLTTIASVYEISKPNGQRALDSNNYGYFGEQRNRGLELSAYGQLIRGLRGIASVAFVDPKLTKTPGGTLDGNDAAGVPDRTASLSLDWDTPWAKGLSVNGRVINTSGAYLTTANTLRFAGWTRYDIGARYRTEIASKAVVFRANVENLFDKNYWLTTGTYVAVGSPRTVVMSATVDF